MEILTWETGGTALLIAAAIGVVTFAVKFDLNRWLEWRTERKILDGQLERASVCNHLWELYPDSPFSRCAGCHALVATSLLNLRVLRSSTVVKEIKGVRIQPDGDTVFVYSI